MCKTGNQNDSISAISHDRILTQPGRIGRLSSVRPSSSGGISSSSRGRSGTGMATELATATGGLAGDVFMHQSLSR